MCNDDTPNESNLEKPLKNIYDSDIKYTVRYTYWLLDILGVWPLVSRNYSKSEKYISKILIILCPISVVFTIVPLALHMILRELDANMTVVLAGPLGFHMANVLKLAFIVFHYKTIKLCMDQVENDWMRIESKNDREIMMRNVRVGRGLTIACGTFMYSGGLSYHIMRLWSESTIDEFNKTVRPLVYPYGYDIFVDPQMSPSYEIIFCTTCISAFVTYTVTTAACNIAAILVTHACGQIQIVISRLESLVDGIDEMSMSESVNSRKLQQRISFIIKCHVRVLRLTSNIEVVVREICLIEVVASTLTICLVEYYCMKEWNNSDAGAILTYLMILLSLMFNIFIFCLIGELLQEQCHQVAKATYMNEWYRLPGKSGLALVMVSAMANFPHKLTAGGMMELSVNSFGNVLKTSFAYLNILRSVAE